MRHQKKKMLSLILVMILLLGASMPALATSREDVQKNPELNRIVQDLTAQKKQLDTTKMNIVQLDKELQNIDAQNEALAESMAAAQDELEAIGQQETEAKDAMQERFRALYMYGQNGYWAILFEAGSGSLISFLTWIDDVKNIMRQDLDQANAILAIINEKRSKMKVIEAAQKLQDEIKTEKEKLLADYQKQFNREKAIYDAQLQAGQALAAMFGVSLNGFSFSSTFRWPIADEAEGAFDITSTFGPRNFLYGETTHTGIDIAAKYGESVMAVADGTVEMAGPYGNYGNCVILNHGQNVDGVVISTLYAHMSSLNVQKGAKVSQSDVIGNVGESGAAFGAHLHLEVWEDKTQVDPINYFTDYLNRLNYL